MPKFYDLSITHFDSAALSSFYSTNKKVGYSEFIPRIKLPPKLNPAQSRRSSQSISQATTKANEEEQSGLPNALFDYDAYDAKIFQLPNLHTAGYNPIIFMRLKFTMGTFADGSLTPKRCQPAP